MINSAEFPRKHLCRNLFFDKVKLCRSPALLKTRLYPRCFFCEFCKIRRNTFFAEHHQTTASGYSSINSIINEGRIGKQTVNYDTKTMYQFEPEV